MKALWNDLIENENGFILSAELVIILTIAVIGIVVGLNHVATAVNQELTDVALAIGNLNQSYSFTGYHCCLKFGNFTSFVAGSAFTDWSDVGDCLCSGPLIGGGEIGNGSFNMVNGGINSGSVGLGVPMTGSAPTPMIGSPRSAVIPGVAVETPCVNCPPVSAPGPVPSPMVTPSPLNP